MRGAPRSGSARPTRAAVAAPPAVPDDLGREHKGTASTQQAFGRFFVDLVREAPEVAERVVTVSPDVGTSTNLGGWINKAGIWSLGDRIDWFADDTDTLVRWRETDHGRHIELGIAEVNLVGLLGELGATWSRDGQPLLPVGTIYDPFVARALEPWSFGIYAGGQSILVGTPSGVTLGPEGGAHQSVITPSIGIEQPGCVAWEPAFGQDLEWTLPARAVAARPRRTATAAYFRLSTRPIDQSLHTRHARGGARGGYRLRAGRRPARRDRGDGRARARGGRGRRHRCARRPGVEAEVVCITSADLLFRSFQARAGLGEGDPATLDRLFPHDVPIVTLVDGHPHTLAFLGGADRLPRRAALRPVGRPRRALRAPRDRRRVGGRRRARPAGLTERYCRPMFTTRPELRGTFGMVASTHWLASGVGMSVLERGGNAFDAASRRGSCCRWSSRTSTGRAGTCRPSSTRRRRRGAGRVRAGPAPGRGDDRRATPRAGLDLVPGTGPLAASSRGRSTPGR